MTSYAYDPEFAPWAPDFAELSFADIPAARAGEAELLAALPPYDAPVPLDVDEGIAYAQRLMAAGVPTELHVYPGAFHACTWLSQAAICQRILGDQVHALRRRLQAPVPEGV